ncbi:motility associated factor glycosyltransferase family protein [Lysinibacillus sp. 54212]|uniref:motility associated factor glycosyltransferase family protein n=1 Tax=Lysinibacillus sp. 54212 TaxID=3119829 RepID=UPI002FC80986
MSEYNIEYLNTKNGLNTVKVNNYFLHSKYNPIQEAERIVEKEFEPNYIHVVFGYGLGYIIDEIKKKLHKKESLIVIDPLYKKIQGNAKNANHDFILVEDIRSEVIEEVLNASLRNLSIKVKIICSPNYDKILKKEYFVVLESIKTVQRIHQVRENTTRQFSFGWQENYINNILHTYMNHSLKEIKQRYNCPIVVISGGPSLKKQISMLKKVKDNVIMIASGSTINSLLHYHIEPDYIVSIDGGISNYNHFKSIGNIKSHLIFGFSSHYKIQETFPNTKYALLDAGDNDFQKYVIDKFAIEIPLIAGGASVANFAFTVASYMTKGPIAIIGQDLAYTDNKSHEDSNKHFIKIDEAYKKERGMFEVNGYYDDKVLTDYAFLLMKKDFERLNKQMKHSAPIFNCTEGGVKIEGMNQLPFSVFCDLYVNEDVNIKKSNQSKTKNFDLGDFVKKMQEEISIYNKIMGEIKIGLVKLDRNKSNTVFDKSVLRELDSIDKSIKKYKSKTAMNHIFDPITMDVLRNYEPVARESNAEVYQRVFNQNKELYSRLLEAFEFSKQYIENVIENTNKFM